MSRSLSEIRERCNEIREVLESGLSSHTVDGSTTTYDLNSLRIELRKLEMELPEFRDRRPRSSRVRLDHC